jgi:hypothetical protein
LPTGLLLLITTPSSLDPLGDVRCCAPSLPSLALALSNSGHWYTGRNAPESLDHEYDCVLLDLAPVFAGAISPTNNSSQSLSISPSLSLQTSSTFNSWHKFNTPLTH